MSKRQLSFRIGGKDLQLTRLVGAFVLLASFLFFVQASANMFNSWDNLKQVSGCIEGANEFSDNLTEMTYCQDQAKKALDIYVSVEQEHLTFRQFLGVLLGPIAFVLVWLAILFIAWTLYRSGDLVIPLEETIREFSERRRKK